MRQREAMILSCADTHLLFPKATLEKFGNFKTMHFWLILKDIDPDYAQS